ncbi:MAG: sigma-70 family RNA polymerase sigma factor [Roseiflexaceae bacterium]
MNALSRVIKQLGAAADEVDWEAVYAEQLPRVYNYFRYRVGDGPLAEDLTATTFEKAWVARARYRRDLAAFATWLFTIARNVAADYYRQRRDDLPLDALCELPDGGRSVDETVQRRSDFARLSHMLAELTPRERELVALKYGASLNNREIARLTDLSESNVGTILHRVMLRLRSAWEAE